VLALRRALRILRTGEALDGEDTASVLPPLRFQIDQVVVMSVRALAWLRN
jgi:hypothetical protein